MYACQVTIQKETAMKTVISSFSGDHSFLSNFYKVSIALDYKGSPLIFPSVEHAFQFAKCTNIEDRRRIHAASECGEAEKRGREVDLRPDWEDAKYGIMETIVLHKFLQNKDLAFKLIATRNKKLVEGNIWGDRTWGVCRGEGLNWLGIILMDVRKVCRIVFNPKLITRG
jgi:ribA/ribD-fused uncharacterized protein